MTRRWALALVVAVSLLSHLKGLTAPPYDYHYHRQANTAAIARNYAENGLRFLHPQIDWAGPSRGRAATEFPLYMWLTGFFWTLFGLGATWGRLLSAAFSALAAVYLYLFLEKRFDGRRALASALLFSAIPLEIYFGRTIQPEALALACTMAALYHWDRFFDRGSNVHWGLAVAAAFLAISHKLPYAYILLALAFLAWDRRGWAAFKDHAVLVAPVLCASAVYSWYRYASAGVYVVPAHPGEFASLFQYQRLPFYVQFQFLSRLPELGATWAGMGLAAAGARRLWKGGERFLFLWWVSVALYLIAGGAYTFHHEYTSLPFAPAMAAFMGCGAVWLWERGGKARAAAAVLVLAMPVLATFRIKHWYGVNFPFLASAQKAADAVSRPYELFVCNQRAASVYLFAMRRQGWCWDLSETGRRGLDDIELHAKKGAKFFMSAASDLTPERRQWLAARYPRVYDADGIEIFRVDGRVPAVEMLALQPPRPKAKKR